MSRVLKNGRPFEEVVFDRDLLKDPVWFKHPKLLSIWIFIQISRSVSYGSMAAHFGVSKVAIGQHIKKMKELRFLSGDPVLEVASSFNPENNTKKSVYSVTVGREFESVSKRKLTHTKEDESAENLMYSDDLLSKHKQMMEECSVDYTCRDIYDKHNAECEFIKCGSVDNCFGCERSY